MPNVRDLECICTVSCNSTHVHHPLDFHLVHQCHMAFVMLFLETDILKSYSHKNTVTHAHTPKVHVQ